MGACGGWRLISEITPAALSFLTQVSQPDPELSRKDGSPSLFWGSPLPSEVAITAHLPYLSSQKILGIQTPALTLAQRAQ